MDELLKEASDIINKLVLQNMELQKANSSMKDELDQYKFDVEREKVADALEEKSLVSYNVLESLRSGNISNDELSKLKLLAENSENLSSFEEDKNASEPAPQNELAKYSFNAIDQRRNDRASDLLEQFNSI